MERMGKGEERDKKNHIMEITNKKEGEGKGLEKAKKRSLYESVNTSGKD